MPTRTSLFDLRTPIDWLTTVLMVGAWLTGTSAASGQNRPDILWETVGHGAGVHAVAFSPGGSWLASGSEDSHVRIWGIANGAAGPDTQNCCGVYSVAFTSNENNIASGSVTFLQFSSVGNGDLLNRWSSGQSFPSIAVSPDGAWLASGSESGGVKVWNSQSGSLVQSLAAAGPCRDIAFSPDGSQLATTSDADVLVWNTSNWNLAHTLSGDSTLKSLQYSRDGSRIVVADGRAQLWRINDESLERTYFSTNGAVLSAALSPDSQFIVGNSSFDNKIIFWNVASGSIVRTYDDGTDYLQKIQFSSSGRLFAYGQINGNLVVARNPDWPVGDLDGDGIVGPLDQTLFINVLLGTDANAEHRLCSDFNDDDIIDGRDLALFVSAIIGA